jgi:hypothetical protein
LRWRFFCLWVQNRLVAFACLKDFTSCFRNTTTFSLVDLNVRRMQTEMNTHPASVTPGPGRLGLVFCLFEPSVIKVSQISGLHPRRPGSRACHFVTLSSSSYILLPSFARLEGAKCENQSFCRTSCRSILQSPPESWNTVSRTSVFDKRLRVARLYNQER